MLSRLARRRASRQARRAQEAHDRLDVPEERRRWEHLLRREPLHPKALRRAAELAAWTGDAARSEALWTRALELPALEARAHGELARRAFDRAELDRARRHADAFLARTEPERRAFSLRRQIESLHAHLEVDPDAPVRRHLCVTGVAFSGTTLLGHLIGRRGRAANVGESHWLVHRRVARESFDIDFDRDANEPLFFCNACGPGCEVWTWEARRALSEDRRNWYDRIAERLGAGILVSTDKNQLKQLTHDPWLRFDVIVSFRHPAHAWRSAARPGRKWRAAEAYLRRWDEHYRKLAFDLPNRGRKLFLDLDAFRRSPERSLAQLRRVLDLPAEEREGPDHSIGGNGRVVAAFRERPRVEIVPEGGDPLPEHEATLARGFAARSELYAHMCAESERVFGAGSRAEAGAP